jgi:hypothetical protein
VVGFENASTIFGISVARPSKNSLLNCTTISVFLEVKNCSKS